MNKRKFVKFRRVFAFMLAMVFALYPVNSVVFADQGALEPSAVQEHQMAEAPGGETGGGSADVSGGETGGGPAEVPGGETGEGSADVPGGETGEGPAEVPGGETGEGPAEVPGGETGEGPADVPGGATGGGPAGGVTGGALEDPSNSLDGGFLLDPLLLAPLPGVIEEPKSAEANISGQKVTLQNEKGEELTGPIDPKAVARLQFDFTLKTGEDVKEGDFLEVDLKAFSNAFDIGTDAEKAIEIKLEGTNEHLATVTVAGEDGSKVATITFTSLASTEKYTSIDAFFWMEATLKTEISDTIDWKEIQIPFMGDAQIEWNEPAELEPEIKKTGTYDKERGTVTWDITVGPKGIDLSGATITDTLGQYLSYVEGSAKLNGTLVKVDQVQVNGSTITYTFPEGTKGEAKLSITTKVDLAAMKGASASEVTNTATLNWHDVEKTDTAKVPIEMKGFITKDGRADGGTVGGLIWTIKVNQNQFPVNNVVVTDDLKPNTTFTSIYYTTGSDSTQKPLPEKSEAGENDPYYTLEGQRLMVFLCGNDTTNTTWTLTLRTKIISFEDTGAADACHVQFYNAATVTWGMNGQGSGSGGGSSYSESVSAGATLKIFEKYGGAYDPVTRTAKWGVYVDPKGATMEKVVITDDFKETLRWGARPNEGEPPHIELAVDSAIELSVAGGETISLQKQEECTPGTQHYHYTNHVLKLCLGTITARCNVTFTTTVNVDMVKNVMGSAPKKDDNVGYRNFARLTFTGLGSMKPDIPVKIEDYQDTSVPSSHLRKFSQGYDYKTRVATWMLDINSAKSALEKPVLIDQLPTGWEYDSFTLYKVEGGKETLIENTEGILLEGPKVENELVTFTFKDFQQGGDHYRIYLKTHLTEEGAKALLESKKFNKDVNVLNIGHLKSGEMGNGYHYMDSAETTIKNRVVTKTGEQLTIDGSYINELRWTIDANHLGQLSNISGAAITDTLPEGMSLVKKNDGTYGVKVWELALQGNGSLDIGRQLSAEELSSALSYNEDTRTLVFNLPSNKVAYRIQLDTTISKAFEGQITNEAFIKGFEAQKGQSSDTVVVKKYGSSAQGNLAGSIVITKIDAADFNKYLQGAVFELYKGDVLLDTRTTDERGVLKFARLASGTYTIKEKTAPEGYQLPDKFWTVEVNTENTAEGEDNVKDITLFVQNAKIGGTPPDNPGTPTDPGRPGTGGNDRPTRPEEVIINNEETPAGVKPAEEPELMDEEIPGGGINVDETIMDEAIPAGNLPKTGGIPAESLYGLGALLLVGAGLLRRASHKEQK